MIRFAWLQFRMQVALAAGALAIVAIVLAVTGPNLVHLYDTTVVTCAAQHDCSTATTAFTDTDGPLQVFLAASSSSFRSSSGCSGGRPLSPASSRAAPSAWCGLRGLLAPVG